MSLKFTKSKLTLKNNSKQAVKVLGVKINPGNKIDLFKATVGLSENRVINALSAPNGEIYKLLERGILTVKSSSFMTFESDPGIVEYPVKLISSNHVLNSGTVFLCNASAGNLTLTLPSAASSTNRIFEIKKIDSSNNLVTIICSGAETIDGELSYVIDFQYVSVSIVSSGSQFYII